LKPTTAALLILIGITFFVWVLRGFRLLGVIPGMAIWVLILLCVLAAIVSTVR